MQISSFLDQQIHFLDLNNNCGPLNRNISVDHFQDDCL